MQTKILLFFLFLSGIVLSANVQIDSGRIFLGGGVSYNFGETTSSNPSTYSSNQTESFGANIKIGEFIKKNTAVGIIVSYSTSNSHNLVNADSNYNKGNGFSAGVFYRKYKRLLKKFYFFGEVDAAYNYNNNDYSSTSQSPPYYSYAIIKSNSNGFGISFIPGVSYLVCKKLYMELSMPGLFAVSYNYTTTNYISGRPAQTTKLKGPTFSISSNLYSDPLSNFGIGFKLLLGK